MFVAGTGDKRAVSTPRQKASLIFPLLVLDNEHREGCFETRTKALRKFCVSRQLQQIQTVEKSVFVFFWPMCAYVCMFSSSELHKVSEEVFCHPQRIIFLQLR